MASCKSPRTLLKYKCLITRQLAFRAVLGEHKSRPPRTLQKYKYLITRQLTFASVLGDLLELHPRPGGSLIWRRYGGGVGNRCRWAERFAMSEQRQSMERHFQRSRELFRTDRGRPCPREWEDPQAKRCGGMERSGSLCGRVAAPRETLHGRQCGSIGKHLLAREDAAGRGTN